MALSGDGGRNGTPHWQKSPRMSQILVFVSVWHATPIDFLPLCPYKVRLDAAFLGLPDAQSRFWYREVWPRVCSFQPDRMPTGLPGKVTAQGSKVRSIDAPHASP
jgi:hypothetical protein